MTLVNVYAVVLYQFPSAVLRNSQCCPFLYYTSLNDSSFKVDIKTQERKAKCFNLNYYSLKPTKLLSDFGFVYVICRLYWYVKSSLIKSEPLHV